MKDDSTSVRQPWSITIAGLVKNGATPGASARSLPSRSVSKRDPSGPPEKPEAWWPESDNRSIPALWKRSTIVRAPPSTFGSEDDEVVAPVVGALAAQRLGAAGALGAGLDAEEALQHVVLFVGEVVEQEHAHAIGAGQRGC